jgi:hypothetical protein
MKNEELAEFLANAPIRANHPKAINARMLTALLGMEDDAVSIAQISQAASVPVQTIWHRLRQTWNVLPVGYIVGTRGRSIKLFGRKEIIRILQDSTRGSSCTE